MYGLLRPLNITSKYIFNQRSSFQKHFSIYNSLTNKNVKAYKSELRAISSLLAHSKTSSNQTCFHISSQRGLSTTIYRFSKQDNDEKNSKNDEDPKGNPWAKLIISTLAIYIGINFIGKFAFSSGGNPDNLRTVSWNEFEHHMLAKGEVKELIVRPDLNLVIIHLHEDAVVKGKKVENRSYYMNINSVEQFEHKLQNVEENLGIPISSNISISYRHQQESLWSLAVVALIGGGLVWLLIRSGHIKTPSSMDFFSQLGKAKFTIVDPLTQTGKRITFKDVAGLREAKQEIMEFVDYLKKPSRYKEIGAKVPKGVLLLGPPGCGKTLLAKAVASEANVPFLVMAGSEFIEMIGGLGAARVRSLFSEARKRSPCIIYIDEIDAIGRSRSESMGSDRGEEEQTLNQLLVEMDGMSSTEGVIMLASTNRSEVLDQALLRPGRFDRHIMLDLPTLIERQEIFERHLQNIKLDDKPEFYSPRLAHLTPGFSGADIANVCNEAALYAARKLKKSIHTEELEYAVERVVGGTEKRTQVMSPEEKKIVAFHECGHALMGWLQEYTDALLKVSIVPRSNKMLAFSQYIPSEQKLYTKEQLFDRMCMALGGRVAESLVFNRVSTGAQDDLNKVTKMAYSQITLYGMDPIVGHLSFPTKEELGMTFKGKFYSKKMAAVIDKQVQKLVADAYKKTEKLLLSNMNQLNKLAEALLKHETLNFKDIETLIGPPPYGKKQGIDTLDWGPIVEEVSTKDKAKPTSKN